MGNELTKKYEVAQVHSASGGHERLWKCYAATSKATGQAVTVCVFKKDDPAIKKLDRAKAEQLFDIMRKDVRFLQAQAHNRILRVIEVLEDSKKLSAFVCERVICSLADFLSGYEAIPREGLAEESLHLRLAEVEVARGIAHIAEGLQFLHMVNRRIHMNVCPESIFITPQGHWKLCGLGFSLGMEADSRASPSPYFGRDPDGCPYRLEPFLNYAAPEMSDGGPGRVITAAADLFSLGVCAYDAFRFAEANTNSHPSRGLGFSSTSPLFSVPSNRASAHVQVVHNALERVSYDHVPMGFRNSLAGLLQVGATARLDVVSLISTPYFHTGSVGLLRSIDDVIEKPVGQQASFLTALPDQLHMFEPRILKSAVVPALVCACISTPELWQHAMGAVEAVALRLQEDEVRDTVLNSLKPGLKVRLPEVMKAFVMRMHFLLQYSSRDFFQTEVVPMLQAAIETSDANIQTLTLKSINSETALAKLDNQTVEQQLVPCVCKVAVHTEQSGVRVSCLILLAKTFSRLPSGFLVRAILPTLKAIRQTDTSAGVSMCLLGCYDVISPLVGPENVASSVLPIILGMISDKNLNARQYEMAESRLKSGLWTVLCARRESLSLPTPSSSLVSTGPPPPVLEFVGSPASPADVYSTGVDVHSSVPDRPPPLPPKEVPPVAPFAAFPSSAIPLVASNNVTPDPFSAPSPSPSLNRSNSTRSKRSQAAAVNVPSSPATDIDRLFAGISATPNPNPSTNNSSGPDFGFGLPFQPSPALSAGAAPSSSGFPAASSHAYANAADSDPFAGLSRTDAVAGFGLSSQALVPISASNSNADPWGVSNGLVSNPFPSREVSAPPQAPLAPSSSQGSRYSNVQIRAPPQTTSRVSNPSPSTKTVDLFGGLMVSASPSQPQLQPQQSSDPFAAFDRPTQSANPTPAYTTANSSYNPAPNLSGQSQTASPFMGHGFGAPVTAQTNPSSTTLSIEEQIRQTQAQIFALQQQTQTQQQWTGAGSGFGQQQQPFPPFQQMPMQPMQPSNPNAPYGGYSWQQQSGR